MTYEFTSYSEYDGCQVVNFKLNGRDSLVVRPKNPLPDNPTAWRAEFFGAFDYVDRALLEKGWHLCYHRVSDMYGADASLDMMHEFHEFIIETFGLPKEIVLFGFSRGGLYSVGYAHRYPEFVKALYLDAPVCDIRTWPCGNLNSRERVECMFHYRLTNDTLPNFDRNPLDKLDVLKEAGIPIMLVAGEADTVVPWLQNGKILAEKYKAMGGEINVITKPDCDHHPHSLSDPTPVVEYLEKVCF